MKEEPSFFSDDLKLIFFGGKGGVGKTTCAAATALRLSERGRNTLIFSTDPAHSLSDSFSIHIGNKITPIKNNLYGLEIDSGELIEEFMKENEITITEIIDRGTYLDTDDIFKMLSSSLPGMDEYMAILKIRELMREKEYDLFISDTAPTGHTIRLLLTPGLMDEWVNFLDKLEDKHRYIARTFRGRYVKDETDAFLEKMHKDLRMVLQIFMDSKTEFVPVTIPEAMGVEETADLLSALQNLKINVRSVIINRANLAVEECDFCTRRAKDQIKYIKDLEKWMRYDVIRVPLFPHEIRGLERLSEFSEVLAGKPYEYKPTVEKRPRKIKAKSRLKELLEKELKVLIFGGKGGVGKTTTASASGLYIARRNPEKKILIFSTDPAHSLSDCFNLHIGNTITKIEDNLYGLERDAEEAMDEFREKYIEEIKEAFDALADRKISIDLPFDRDILQRLKELTPPGLDEIMALMKMVELMKSSEYDLIILDTAPTGHTIRLLELPDIALEWFDAFSRIIYKYRGLVSLKNTLRFILDKKKDTEETIKILRSEGETEFVVVTIPEAMSVFETERLVSELKKAEICLEHVIINGIIPIPATECSFCISQLKNQREYVKELRKLGYKITEMPLFEHEIRGIDMLADFGKVIYGEGRSHKMGIGNKLFGFLKFQKDKK
ncbi:MAG: TRC40/GET3/ArsA family transport-energizing ATPase [archaeon]|nr:TRC40/GET3/ArsA family transport-energizing ATPase [archaeon]